MADQSGSGAAAIVYIFSAVIFVLALFGGTQTIRHYKRGDISGRFPLLLLFNGFCILLFAIFSVLALATDLNQHVINVLLLSTGSLTFTVQLLRAIRLLFTIEVRYFISKQFAHQFAYGDGEDIYAVVDDGNDFDDHSVSSGSYASEDMDNDDEDDYDEMDDYYDEDPDYEGSVNYSASYHDYEERDIEFNNPPHDDTEDDEPEPVQENALVDPNAPNDELAALAESSQFSTASSLSQDSDEEEDLGNALGRWIFNHKSLASSSFMTGLALFIFCKYILLLVLFTTTCGLNWAWILWIVVLVMALLSSALTIASLKMVRIRAYYIYERQLADYNEKHFGTKETEVEERNSAQQRPSVPQPIVSPQHDLTSGNRSTRLQSSRRSGDNRRSNSDSRDDNADLTSTHKSRLHGSTRQSKMQSQRERKEKKSAQKAIMSVADSSGAVSIFGTKIVETNTQETSFKKNHHEFPHKTQNQKKKPVSKITSVNQSQSESSTPKPLVPTNSSSNTHNNSESSVNKSNQPQQSSQLFDAIDPENPVKEADANLPPPPVAPPTTLFTSAHDPSGQMMELLISALGSGVFYGLSLLLAIIYSAQYEYSDHYGYFIITPTRYSPSFTHGILILLLLSNIIVVYTSLVHIVVAESVRSITYKIIGGAPTNEKITDAALERHDSLKKILDDPGARDEFRKFLDGEFSAENLLFWNAIEEYRARPIAHFQSRSDTISSAKYIFSTYLAPGGVYEVNISSQCREKISTRLKTLLDEDPIAKVKELELREIRQALDAFNHNNALYHDINIGEGVVAHDYGNPEDEEQLPKSKRILAQNVAQKHTDEINAARRPELRSAQTDKAYPAVVFEQYLFVQIGDIYQTITKIIQQSGPTALPAKRGLGDYNEKSHTKPDQGYMGRQQHVLVVDQDRQPLPPPSRLPSIATQRQNPEQLDSIISMLHSQNNTNGNPMLSYQAKNVNRVAMPESESDEMTDAQNMAEIDQNVVVNEFSRTVENRMEDTESEDDEPKNIYEDKIQPNWTIYDVIRYKFQQFDQYNGKTQGLVPWNMTENTPYPPPAAGDKRRRRKGGPAPTGGPELLGTNGNTVRLHYALMSYSWKLRAALRRLKQYTEVVDELVVVFDAAQLEIFKLMERDSFARFIKTTEFQIFVQNQAAAAAQAE